ncbi:signal peptide peptidase SppA [Oscillatoria sp. FACHB-1407]|uniref:signal peptide peptidase SppA n=1 Tax=Oscillatoria sp. FACHB-1407 TaxID=2692847 RepID=UPI001686C822|nr:signal peptide peptidase SppA [Oscillatoria sp. FACHB-1407]MBD2464335.1 signal peptide peptidase SppA [Oscillatoria sp. FACHB-1407]
MRDFLKFVFATLVGLTLFSVGGFMLLVAIIAAIAAQETAPALRDKTVLAFDLSLNITDTPPGTYSTGAIEQVLAGDSEQQIAFREVLNALEAAATDDRIVGLYLYNSVNPSAAGFANLTEIRQALQTFQESGKPILAYEMQWTERDYYLTSVADTVMLNPAGVMELNGFKSETAFFAEALEKYGIGIQVTRVGEYKSAVEPFIRSDRSPADRQQIQKLLTDLWGEFLQSVAKSRELTPQALQAVANEDGLLLASEAESAGLVDRLAYPDEAIAELRKLTEEEEAAAEEDFRQISLPEYAATVTPEPSGFSMNEVALVYVEGDIVSGEGGDGLIGGDFFAEEIRKLRLDENVKAIVLRVNSPGGSATASDLVAREIQLTTEVKPVIVSMGNLAASGGYQIATHATKIYALPSTITGSIGVFGLLPNVQAIANNNGITWDVVKTGQYADIQTITRPRTPAEMAIVQRITDQFYTRFLDTVAESRSLPRQRVAEIAQGRVWSGIEAQRIGLVDEIGGLEEAIQAAAETAELGDDWRLEEYPRSNLFEAELLDSLFSRYMGRSSSRLDPLTLELQTLREDLETLQSMNDPVGIYTRIWFIPRIE